jgi:flagellar biosynthesis/type III secretory pathway protein FliH
VVIPIVFYTGSGTWTVPQSLKEMFEDYALFGDFVIDFKYALVDAKGYTDETVKGFRSKLLRVAMMAEQAQSFVEVLGTMERHKDDVLGLNEEEKRILHMMLDVLNEVMGAGARYDFKKILYANDAKEANTMLSDVLANAKDYELNIRKEGRKEGIKEGRKEGRKEGAIEIAKSLLQENIPIKIIAKSTKLTVKEVKALQNEA